MGVVGARQVTWSTGVAAWGDRGGWLTLAIASVNDAPPNTADITENRVLQCSSPSSENMREGLNGEPSSSKNISRCCSSSLFEHLNTALRAASGSMAEVFAEKTATQTPNRKARLV